MNSQSIHDSNDLAHPLIEFINDFIEIIAGDHLPIKCIFGNSFAMRLFSISIILLLISGRFAAQKTMAVSDSIELSMELIGPEQGLSQGQINGIAEDQHGYLWVATKDGLNRYDGSGFKVYRNDPDDPHSLSENFISSVYVDSRNLLWVGTNSSGLELFDRKHEQFIHISKDQPLPLNSMVQNVHRIIEDFKGQIIIQDATGNKINVISPKSNNNTISFFLENNLLELYPALKNLSMPLNGLNILCITKDGTLWYTENKIVYGFDKSIKKETYRIDAKNIFVHPHAAPFVQTSLDNYQTIQDLYFLDSKNCISKLDICTQTLLPVYEVPSITICANNRFFFDRDKRIWIKQGVRNYLRINPGKDVLDTIVFSAIDKEKLEKISYEIFCQDRYNNIWCGTNGFGLIKLSARNDLFNSASFKCNEPKIVLNSSGEKTLYTNKYKNTDIRLINRMGLDKEGINCLTIPWEFTEDRHNFLWSIANFHLKYYSIKINPSGNYYNKEAIEPIIGTPVIFSDLKGEIWLSANSYTQAPLICRLNDKSDKKKIHYFPIDYIPSQSRFLYDRKFTADNIFWLATTQGLFQFNPESEQWRKYQSEKNNTASLASNYILSLCFDPEKPSRYLWVGTDGGGLNKFDIQSESFQRYSTKDGLPNNVIYGIQSDQHGNFWMSTNSGLCFLNPRTFEIQNFTSKDGLPGNEFNRTEYFKSTEGIFYFGGINGWVCFDPENYYKNKKPSPVVINKLKILNKDVFYKSTDTISNDDYRIPAPIEQCKKLVFTYDQRMIAFGFTVMDFTNPKGNRYKYKMEGFNKDWIDAGTSNEATYTNLSPDKYIFKVLGCNSSNVWSLTPATIDIEIRPPWWGSWWFRICMLLTVVSGIYLFYQYRLQQALKLQSLRNRIAADLHDEIGSTLSSISLASSVIQNKLNDSTTEVTSLLDRISNNTDNMMEAMSDIVWAVNTKNDRFDNVINRMRAFAIEILEPKNILVHFTISPNVSNVILNMQQRKNLYLIFKEAINNAAKYSECKNVWLNIDYNHEKIILEIKDDGIGFEIIGKAESIPTMQSVEVSSNSFGGNGLTNMQKRAGELKGKLIIDSSIGNGTTVRFDFTI
ncbi:MAG: hypothetical protein IPL31_11810 [Saprospiraceae bacterium]|nr:hypothetical protein [Saprospiraceae bacterium]